MAEDLGELLVPYMPTIRVPKSGDRVYKTECAFSYDSPESDGGLYVCMSTFLGFGRGFFAVVYMYFVVITSLHPRLMVYNLVVEHNFPFFLCYSFG
uniref:Ubiquitin carboxyl-terminal hydrolase 13 n=1 Tax=Xenopus tropicalis TaxID=8364 RepID=Q5M8W2_XENTR